MLLCFAFKYPKWRVFEINCLPFVVKVTKVRICHVTSCCKTVTEIHIKKEHAHTRAHVHTHTHTPMLLLNWYWPTFPHDISVTNMAVTCVIPPYVTRQNSQIYLSHGVQTGLNGKYARGEGLQLQQRRFLTEISLLSHIIPCTTVCRQQAGATHRDPSVHWWQNCQHNVCQPIQTSVPRFVCHVLQQILLWWCRRTGTVNCTWHIRQWTFCTVRYHRKWNASL